MVKRKLGVITLIAGLIILISIAGLLFLSEKSKITGFVTYGNNSANYTCEVYDDFSGDLSKWQEISTMEIHEIQNKVYLTKQLNSSNAENILTATRKFLPDEILEYDMNFVTGTGEAKIKLNNNKLSLTEATGIYHIIIAFTQAGAIISGDVNKEINSANSEHTFSVISETNGVVEINYDNFKICRCIPIWAKQTTNCKIDNTKLIIYSDVNNCNKLDNFPVDNGTSETCDYCTPNWAEQLTECVEEEENRIGFFQDSNNCYSQTGLASDLEAKPENATHEFGCVECGDNSCNGEETCDSCSSDCGECEEENSTSETITTPSEEAPVIIQYYKCTVWGEWSECSNGKQTRECSAKETATFSDKTDLTETQDCVVTSSEETGTETIAGETENATKENTSGILRLKKVFSFTGKTVEKITDFTKTFSKTKQGKIIIIVVSGLVLIWIITRICKRIYEPKTKKNSKKGKK